MKFKPSYCHVAQPFVRFLADPSRRGLLEKCMFNPKSDAKAEGGAQ